MIARSKPSRTENSRGSRHVRAIPGGTIGDSAYNHLAEIKQPALVANGSNDMIVPTISSFTMAQFLPNAHLIVYPDSGHGFLFPYPDLFVDHALRFLR